MFGYRGGEVDGETMRLSSNMQRKYGCGIRCDHVD